MVAAKGVGLAANQIGQPWRVCIVQQPEKTIGGMYVPGVAEIPPTVLPADVVALVNPEIVAKRGEVVLDEGCLSVPNEFEKVLRSVEVDVRFQNVRGEWVELHREGQARAHHPA